MPILGIIASSFRSAAGPEGAYDALATVTVGATSVSSVAFAGIPTGYKHLQLRVFGFQSTSNDVFLKLNSNAGVRKHRLTGNGSAASAGADTGTASGLYLGNLGWDATYPTIDIIDILDASNTSKYKTVRNLGGTDKNGSGTIFLESYLFDDTAAVSSITITGASNFSQYTSFALYGVK